MCKENILKFLIFHLYTDKFCLPPTPSLGSNYSNGMRYRSTPNSGVDSTKYYRNRKLNVPITEIRYTKSLGIEKL